MASLTRIIGSEGEDLQTISDRRKVVAAASVENCRLSGAVATVHRRTATALRLAATALRLTATARRLSLGEGAVDMGKGRRLTEAWSATM